VVTHIELRRLGCAGLGTSAGSMYQKHQGKFEKEKCIIIDQ
jgi:hypothetical protein